jgi:PAS domain S-box-containing protein
MDSIRLVSQQIEAAENARWLAAWNDLQVGAQRVRLVTLLAALLLAALVAVGGGALISAEGQLRQVIGNLDESKQSAERMRDLLRATLYSIGDGVITTDRDGAVQMMNAVAERLTGYQEKEAHGESVERVFRIVNEQTRNAVENPIRRVLRDGQVVGLANHTVLISKAGADIPIDDSGAPIAGSDGNVHGVVLVFRDVSQRKRAEETAQRLAAIVESSDDAIIGKTLEGTVTSWNRGAERLFGYSAEEMIGTPVARLIPPNIAGDESHILERIRSGGSVDHYQTERLAKDGRRITVSLTVSPIRDGEGHVVGASKIARDITRERQLQELMQQTQKMEAVGRLAGGVAHDFNNLLTVILGYATVVKSRLTTEDPLRNTVTEILRAGEQAAAVTGQLLSFSRKQVSLPEVLDLGSSIGEMSDILQRLIGEDIGLALIVDPSPCLVKIDPGQLTQVLMNLAVNARDAMPTGGKLTIETQTILREQEDLGRRGARPSGRYSLLAVTDTGAGMDAETQAHIFEPFFTTKQSGKGTGLGLATVYGIVQQHGGWIDVYSEVGQGTTFRIYLPAADHAIMEPPPASDQPSGRRAATILLVEDQAAIRMLAEDVLIEAGHRVLSANSGRTAMELMERCEDRIDLLITDVVMPEMSGPELANRLSGSQADMIVLYISGYTGHALLHRGAIEQGTAFLQKPFLPESLLIKVDELLRVDTNARGAVS